MLNKHLAKMVLSWTIVLIIVMELALNVVPVSASSKIDLSGPAGSGRFGTSVTVLPNGNFVVIDAEYDAGMVADAGAAYLYNGSNLSLISTLTGSTANDRVGSYGVKVLTNGNYVVRSQHWINGAAADARRNLPGVA